jgi:hypothetical protein
MALQLTDFINLAQVPELKIDTHMYSLSGTSGTVTTGSLPFTPLAAFFQSALISDANPNEGETLGTGFAIGTGIASSPLSQCSAIGYGGDHSSGTPDNDHRSVDFRYIAGALAHIHSSVPPGPLTDHLDVSSGGGTGACALRVTQFTSSGIILTPFFAGAATTVTGRIFAIILGFEV